MLLLGCSTGSRAGSWEKYAKQFREVLTNASMEYQMSCWYPDSSKEEISGRMAIKPGCYYDSSNARFVLLDRSWYLIADHRQQLISVAYVPAINKKLEGIGSLMVSSYMLPQNVIDVTELHIVREEQDTAWLQLNLKDIPTVEQLIVKIRKSDLMPLGYEARIRYALTEPDPENEDLAMNVLISIRCNKIIYPAPDYLFDHSRIIATQHNKSTLKRFQQYKTFKP
jgi:hypothetical protein